jgi:hypothetical protein
MKRGARLAALLVTLAACRATEPPSPPPSPAQAPAPPPAPPAPPPSPQFVVTESSDTWVRETFHVQAHPVRVLVVTSQNAPASVPFAPLDLNARSPAARTESLPVSAVYRTLQEAADAARGGDLVAVMPGKYRGFWIGDKPDAGDERYIHFQAMGEPGSVVIDAPAQRDGDRWMILLQTAHHVIVEGFNLAGHDQPGDEHASGPWAGIMIDGDFGASGKLAHHIAVIGNYSHHHRNWGLHSTDSHTVLLQDNLFAFSAREHAAYVSDGSDNYVIRRNVFFGSYACGLQCNLDPEASLDEVMKHPAMRDYPRGPKDRAWALRLLQIADQRFGPNNYPDGRGLNFIIESNVINQNGRLGGAGINLAGLQRSLIRNNLVYDNRAHGIAAWDNANPFDGPALDEAIWGCKDNVFRNNTVLMSNVTRAALQCRNGSTGCRALHNILINDGGPSMQIDRFSLPGFEAHGNVLRSWNDDRSQAEPSPVWANLPDPGDNQLGVTRASLASEVVRASDEPWVIFTGSWWALNPNRPDFRPRTGAKVRADAGARPEYQ